MSLITINYIDLLLITLGYLAGSVSSAILVAKALGLADPRSAGSGNPGATNMLRLSGKKAAALTLAGDVLKGFIPVFAAKLLGVSELALMLTALAAFLGHLYPVFFHFKGGKGVATALGVLLAAYWQIGLFTCIVWLLTATLLRISSLSALTAFLLTPVFVLLFFNRPPVLSVVTLITVMIFWRHRSNIKNLLHGTEGK